MKHLLPPHRRSVYVLALPALFFLLLLSPLAAQTAYDYSRLSRERLNRGTIAIRTSPDSVLVSWRYLESDPTDVTFEILRDRKVIGRRTARQSTTFMDYNPEPTPATYTVRPVYANGNIPRGLKTADIALLTSSWTLPEHAPLGYLDIPITPPNTLTPPGPPSSTPSSTPSPSSSSPSSTPSSSSSPSPSSTRSLPVGDGTAVAPPPSPHYTPNDATMADLDGDGQLEIILKWDPSNSKDNSQSGITSPTILEALRLDGTSLWRVNLGPNIRSGAHYTPFIVADLDGDGRAELLVRTSDGAIDGQGTVLGDPKADHVRRPDTRVYQANNNPGEQFRGPGWPNNMSRNTRRGGFIYKGPEWVTCFDGRTGRAISTVDYIPERGELKDWGDNYANRSDRFLAACAYLDGQHLSAIFCRGYYTRSVLAAYDFDGKDLKVRWVFDTNTPEWASYAGQGNHNLRVGDVDGDGCDEITYGSMAVDHDGRGLYNTGMGHGDAMHLTAFFPPETNNNRPTTYRPTTYRPTPLPLPVREGSGHLSQAEKDVHSSKVSTPLPHREGQGGGSVGGGSVAPHSLQLWDCHENKRDGTDFRDARTGRVLFQILSDKDVGRCMAADIDPTNPGLEMWSSASSGICNLRGEVIDSTSRVPINFGIWWDGDLLRELLDHEAVSKYQPLSNSPRGGENSLSSEALPPTGRAGRGAPSRACANLITFNDCAFNNGTKSNPALCADIIGDWREEVLTRTADNRHLRLYVSPLPTAYRFHTFLSEPVYRHSVTMQNVGYNQPTNVGFYFGAELEGSGLLFRGWQF